MKFLTLIFILISFLNICSSTRFSVACGRFQDNEKLFFGKCSFNSNPYDRIIEFTNYIFNSDPNLDLNDFLRNYLTENATNYFRETYQNDSYIEKLNNFVAKLSLVMDELELENSLSKVNVSKFFEAAKSNQINCIFRIIFIFQYKLQVL